MPQQERHGGDRDHDERVEQDLLHGLALAAHDRQHRDPRLRVVALDQERQRPEVRRRPEEDDQEERDRRQSQVPGRGRPADQRRDRAGGPADDDVLRRRALQPAGVDEDVEEVPDERQRRGQDVDRAGEQHERERRQREPELERVRRRHPAGGDRPRARPLAHQRVDVAVDHVVERAGAAAGEREPDDERGQVAERRHALRADEHPADPGQEQQRHDPRLGQRHVVRASAGRQPVGAAARQRAPRGT